MSQQGLTTDTRAGKEQNRILTLVLVLMEVTNLGGGCILEDQVKEEGNERENGTGVGVLLATIEGTKLSPSFHPQTDRQSKIAIQSFLSTKDNFEADEYTRDLDTAFATVVRETLQKSQERQKKVADRHRRDLKLKENDWVLLRFEKARLRKKKRKERLFPKFSMRYYGPFQVTERINDVSFRLRLPDTWKIHNAFHVSLLKPFKGDVPNIGEPDDQPEVEENEEILVPEQILAHKVMKNKGKVRRQFLVKFKNYPALDAKWMEEDLAYTPQIVNLYLEAFGLA
ncbi:hypothetical protein L7F22_013993 [Adiantum nelumboides]|nr:hypothetical protein [Adiantum nelumboides]